MMSAYSSMFISHLIPYFALIWSLSYLLVFDKMLIERNGGERRIADIIVPLATLGFAGLFVILPIRTVLNKCLEESNLRVDSSETY